MPQNLNSQYGVLDVELYQSTVKDYTNNQKTMLEVTLQEWLEYYERIKNRDLKTTPDEDD